MANRKYPIGIQTFSEIINGGYIYVDKTDLVWQLAHYAKFVFMSRPRRFGKSLLTSTLDSYFRGEKSLFDGLKIMALEQAWEQYPVIHLDLSGAKHMSPQGIRQELVRIISDHEKLYGRNEEEITPGMRFAGVVSRAFDQTGSCFRVVSDYSVFFINRYAGEIADMLVRACKLIEKRSLSAILVADKRERQRLPFWNCGLGLCAVLCKMSCAKFAVPRVRYIFYALCTFVRVVAKMNAIYLDFFGIFKPERQLVAADFYLNRVAHRSTLHERNFCTGRHAHVKKMAA